LFAEDALLLRHSTASRPCRVCRCRSTTEDSTAVTAVSFCVKAVALIDCVAHGFLWRARTRVLRRALGAAPAEGVASCRVLSALRLVWPPWRARFFARHVAALVALQSRWRARSARRHVRCVRCRKPKPNPKALTS
jgi:hypothetical protein